MAQNQVAQSETLEQIASEIMRPAIGKVAPAIYCEMEIAIIEALRNEREACAKLLDVRVVEISNYQTRPYRVARRELEAAARAIREGR